MRIRNAIFALGVVIAGVPGGNLRAQAAPPAAKGTTYVIVHGAWGGSWAFREVAALLTARGHAVYRPSLTGLGERVHLATPEVGLATHVNDVVNAILYEDFHDIVLVGHSYGGMVISGVADRVPDRIRRLVYLDAFVPEDGESVMTMPAGQAGREAFLKPMMKDGFLVPFWLKPGQPPPADVPQPLKTFTEPVSWKNPAAKRLPATYILTVDKGAQTDDFDAQAARAKERGWTMLRMEGDHNVQWSAPKVLVELLDGAR